MTNTPPNKQPSLHDIDDSDSTNTPQQVRKRDKVLRFLGILKFKTKDLKRKASNQSLNVGRSLQATGPPLLAFQATRQPVVASLPKDACSDDNMSISSYALSINSLPTPSPPIATKGLSIVFAENLIKPALRTDLPTLLDHIEKTEQL
ncbi:hypothetical protein BGX24_003439, partial [Mortierella sp. AD032]